MATLLGTTSAPAMSHNMQSIIASAMTNMHDNLEGFYALNKDHKSMDIIQLIMNVFQTTKIIIPDTWDYFLHSGKKETKEFLTKLIDGETEPFMFAVEVMNKRFEHVAFYIGTSGFRQFKIDDFYTFGWNRSVVKNVEQQSKTNVFITVDQKDSVSSFIDSVFSTVDSSVFSDQSEKDIKEIGASIDIEIEGVDDIERFSGFAIYGIPLQFSPDLYQSTLQLTQKENTEEEKELIEESEMVRIIDESEEVISNDYIMELYKRYGTEMMANEVDFEKLKKALGKLFDSSEDSQSVSERNEYMEIYFKHGSVLIPYADNAFYIKIQSASSSAKIEIFFENEDDFINILSDVLPEAAIDLL